MTIQHFAMRLEEKHAPSSLLQALQALRTRDLDQLRRPSPAAAGWTHWEEPQAEGLYAGWVVWEEPVQVEPGQRN